jgi:hypothetical protein
VDAKVSSAEAAVLARRLHSARLGRLAAWIQQERQTIPGCECRDADRSQMAPKSECCASASGASGREATNVYWAASIRGAASIISAASFSSSPRTMSWYDGT